MPLSWRGSNIPIPPQYVVSLVMGVVLEAWVGFEPLLPAALAVGVGLVVGLTGLAFITWAVRAAGLNSLVSLEKLVTRGPYAHTRNPMYVGWALLYLGTALAVQSIWLLSILPFTLAWTHFHDILKEERALLERFGQDYKGYQSCVARYFTWGRSRC